MHMHSAPGGQQALSSRDIVQTGMGHIAAIITADVHCCSPSATKFTLLHCHDAVKGCFELLPAPLFEPLLIVLCNANCLA
eukprot:1009-Heterococcus_DN1.PRE.1